MLTALAILVLAAAAPRAPADSGPTWSPGGLQVAYSHSENPLLDDEPVTLVARYLDGSGARTLVHPTGTGDLYVHATDPSWSPDGRWIAYTFSDPVHGEGAELALVAADGSQGRFLGRGARPAWSPDGTQLAFVDGGLYVTPVSSFAPRRLDTGGGTPSEPTWSRAGRIAYTRITGRLFSVWSIAADGSDARQEAPGLSGPAWKPDGTLTATRGDGAIVLATSGRRLTPASLRATDPEWSRDGTKLAFSADVATCRQPGSSSSTPARGRAGSRAATAGSTERPAARRFAGRACATSSTGAAAATSSSPVAATTRYVLATVPATRSIVGPATTS